MPLTVTEISAPDILAVARIQEKRGAMETAHRCIQVIGQVFRYHGHRSGSDRSDPGLERDIAPGQDSPHGRAH